MFRSISSLLKKIINLIDQFLAFLSIALIRLYQLTLSPDKGLLSFLLKGKICSHEPHCSQYGLQTLKRY